MAESKKANYKDLMSKALIEIKSLRARLNDAKPVVNNDPIAIIGMSCRLPGGSNNGDLLWENLEKGNDLMSEIPGERMDVEKFYDPSPESGGMYTRTASFIDDIEKFDASFFGISPREANAMDPQQRILLELSWEALENAGIKTRDLENSETGVYIGVVGLDYGTMQLQESYYDKIDTYSATGAMSNIIAGRISYALGLQGPCIAMDTACSSSLVALHLACNSLHSGESNMALVGGSNVLLDPAGMIMLSKTRALAPDGHCKTFDASADGYARGEGCVMFVIKRLADARRDADPILAIIKGAAIRHDGPASGLTVPNADSQRKVIRDALERARVKPASVSYIECHGTGTPLGDPIEVRALGKVYGEGRDKSNPLMLGSLKTNMGHLEGAAGLSGLAKVVLALGKKIIPPHINLKALNPAIELESIPASIPVKPTRWDVANGGPRIAGLSSFGMSGTNAHVVIQEASEDDVERNSGINAEADLDRPVIFPLSAKTANALRQRALDLRSYLIDTKDSISLNDIGYTLSLRRDFYEHRLALIAKNKDELVDKLERYISGDKQDDIIAGQIVPGENKKVAFIFTGQGSQWSGMGNELFKTEPIFREALEEIDELIKREVDWSLINELKADESNSRIHETEFSQPAIFAMQIALTKLWESRGIKPRAVVGHSVGEVAAAFVSGRIRLEDAVHLIINRARLMQQADGLGKMAAVGLSHEEVQNSINGRGKDVFIAAINSPSSCVLSGSENAMLEVLGELEKRGVYTKMLRMNYAFHSPFMEPFKDELVTLIGKEYSALPGTLPLYSTVRGKRLENEEMDAVYWGANLREPVQFSQAIESMLGDGYTHFLEVGPHPALKSPVTQCIDSAGVKGKVYSSLKRTEGEYRSLLQTFAEFYTDDIEFHWNKFYSGVGNSVALPNYPWQHDTFWLEKSKSTGSGNARQASLYFKEESKPHPILGNFINSATEPDRYTWEFILDLDIYPFLKDHRIYDTVIFPGAAITELSYSAARRVFGEGLISLENVEFGNAIPLGENKPKVVQLILTKKGADKGVIQIYSLDPGSDKNTPLKWSDHSYLEVTFQAAAEQNKDIEFSIEDFKSSAEIHQTGDEHREFIHRINLPFGPQFMGLEDVWIQGYSALARIGVPEALSEADTGYYIHPTVLDSGFQAGFELAVDRDDVLNTAPLMGTGFGKVTFYKPYIFGQKLWCFLDFEKRDESDKSRDLKGSAIFFDDDGEVLIEISGGGIKRLIDTQTSVENILFDIHWEKAASESGSEGFFSKNEAWLIFGDRSGSGDKVFNELSEKGARCYQLYPGVANKKIDEFRYEINANELEGYTDIFETLFIKPEIKLKGILYCWGLDITTPETSANLDNLVDKISIMPTLLIQAINKSALPAPPELYLISRGGQATPDDEQFAPNPFQSPLWGLGRVIKNEHPELSCVCVDLGFVDEEQEIISLIGEISKKNTDDEVALRGRERYVARLVKNEDLVSATWWEERERKQDESETWRPRADDATYLVTGGLRGLGLQFSRRLVERGAKNLALLARSKPDADTLKIVEGFRRKGANVLIVNADVADYDGLKKAFQEIKENLPPIRGIIHAAGALSDSIIMNMDREKMYRAIRPKIHGTWNLHLLSLELEIEVFVNFSSIAPLVGSPGQSNYVVANSFQDAISHYRKYHNLRCLSVNWGAFAGTGLVSSQSFSKYGLDSLTPQQGMAALEILLTKNVSQIPVMPLNLSVFSQMGFANNLSFLRKLAGEGGVSEGGDKSSEKFIKEYIEHSQEKSKRQELVGNYLHGTVAKTLGLTPGDLSPEASFNTIGFDSLMTLQLRNTLESQIKVKLDTTVLWKYPTIPTLVEYLDEMLEENVSSLPEGGVGVGPGEIAGNGNKSDSQPTRKAAEKKQTVSKKVIKKPVSAKKVGKKTTRKKTTTKKITKKKIAKKKTVKKTGSKKTAKKKLARRT